MTKYRFLDSPDGLQRVICSFFGKFEKIELLPVEACQIYSIEWIINSDASFEITDASQHLLYITGNGRVENFSTPISKLEIEPVHQTTDSDTVSVILTFKKKY